MIDDRKLVLMALMPLPARGRGLFKDAIRHATPKARQASSSEKMATSFSTLSFPPRTQRPVSFVHYSGPKTVHKPAPARATRGDEVTDIEASLVNSMATNASRETIEPSGPAWRGPTTAMANDAYSETYGLFSSSSTIKVTYFDKP